MTKEHKLLFDGFHAIHLIEKKGVFNLVVRAEQPSDEDLEHLTDDLSLSHLKTLLVNLENLVYAKDPEWRGGDHRGSVLGGKTGGKAESVRGDLEEVLRNVDGYDQQMKFIDMTMALLLHRLPTDSWEMKETVFNSIVGSCAEAVENIFRASQKIGETA